jgi:UDP-N-acetylglucosamine 1-carboxyvinyltransferase
LAQQLMVTGGARLKGAVRIGGSKNASVAVLPAALLSETPSTFEDLASISDIMVFTEILGELGAKVQRLSKDTVRVDSSTLTTCSAPYELVRRLRASYYLMGVLLARFGHAEVALPGGCDIGLRPIDQHVKGFKAMGAEVTLDHGVVRLSASKLMGAQIYLDVVSVGATINIMMAASLAEGTTVIENAAKEPHIVDLANYINGMGGKVQGAGTDVIKVRGVKSLTGTVHQVIPDDIEAGTYMMAALACNGDVRLENVIPKHLDSISAKAREAGAEIIENGDWIQVIAPERPLSVNVKTMPYPGFPTDLQQPLVAVISRAQGVSVVNETIFDNRFGYANELIRMGARIKVDGRVAVVEGVPKLSGVPVKANDLRAGAALIIAALAADGESVVSGMEHVDRGYEGIDSKLLSLGAKVARAEGPDDN